MKKIVTLLLSLAAMSLLFVGCSGKKTNAKAEFETSKKIAVGSREDGSGTRGAFIELFGIEEKTADGKKVDHTTKSAVIANQTGGDAQQCGKRSICNRLRFTWFIKRLS